MSLRLRLHILAILGFIAWLAGSNRSRRETGPSKHRLGIPCSQHGVFEGGRYRIRPGIIGFRQEDSGLWDMEYLDDSRGHKLAAEGCPRRDCREIGMGESPCKSVRES